MISRSWAKTTRQWDLKAGKEIEEAQNVCEKEVSAVTVSRDGRWVQVTSGGDGECAELKACEVETGIVKKLQGHSRKITCIDISVDNTLLESGACDFTVRI
jgi:WD40 repeat protein